MSVDSVTIKTFVNQFMDTPKVCSENMTLQPGESMDIELFALFNNTVLQITEATKVAVEISIDYSVEGESNSVSRVETLTIYDRNAVTWDDDRKAAAFISSKDPSVLGIAKNIAGIVSKRGSKALNKNLLMGMGIHAALPVLGLSYVIDPQTPYEELSQQTDVVDFLQFPRQTLYYRAGDCDDLSILYCSFLEAVGIETAFITVPGHIFIAFSTGMESDEARTSFSRVDDLIYHNGKAWIPVEITMLNDGFLPAWREGAKEWRENSTRDFARIYPVHEAWELYKPTGIAAGVEGMQLASLEAVSESFYSEMSSYISQEIYPEVTHIRELMEKRGESPKYLNKLGVIHGRYGLYDQAEEHFLRALEQQPYAPALMNIGNLLFMRAEYLKALGYYSQALEQNPEDATRILSLARCNHELENYGTVRGQYAELRRIDPELAEKFAYLDLRGEEAGRAADSAGIKELVIWVDEE
jgi:tetratricopeptide (TPR) repeat protein